MDVALQPRPDHRQLLAAEALAAEALGMVRPTLSPEEWIRREGPENFRVATVAGEVVGCLTMQRAGQWFGGRSVPMAGVRCVAVAPHVRGRGVLRRLLVASLEELRGGGVPVASLYPSTAKAYRSVGYEIAGLQLTRRVALHALAPLPEMSGEALVTEAVTLAPWSTSPGAPAVPEGLASIYRSLAAHRNGFLDRSSWYWNRVLGYPWAPSKPRAYRFVRPSTGACEGYVVLATNPKGITGDLVAYDLCLATPAAARGALALFHDHRSMFEHLVWFGGPGDDLCFHIGPPVHRIDEAKPWMLRMVDVPLALAARGYPPGVTTEVHLDVRDEVLKANEGLRVLEVRDGRAEVRRGGTGAVVVNVRGLACLYAGGASPDELQRGGLLSGSPADLARLAPLFAGPAPWMPDAF